MKFIETNLKGSHIVEIEKLEDIRGFNARTSCQREFEAHRLNSKWLQTNIIFSKKRGTLRGLHYRAAPFKETKLFRCTKGAIYDVIIDLRPNSPTYKKWISVELSAENYKMLYVPEDFAQGSLTLEDNTEIIYQVSGFYTPECERGVRYDDPAFGIKWPVDIEVISDKDKSWPDYIL